MNSPYSVLDKKAGSSITFPECFDNQHHSSAVSLWSGAVWDGNSRGCFTPRDQHIYLGQSQHSPQSYVWLFPTLLIPCSHKSWAPSANLKMEKKKHQANFFFPPLHRILSEQTAFRRLSIFWVAGSLWISHKVVAHSHQICLKTFAFTSRKLDAQLHFPGVLEWSPWLTKQSVKEAGLCQNCRQ